MTIYEQILYEDAGIEDQVEYSSGMADLPRECAEIHESLVSCGLFNMLY